MEAQPQTMPRIPRGTPAPAAAVRTRSLPHDFHSQLLASPTEGHLAPAFLPPPGGFKRLDPCQEQPCRCAGPWPQKRQGPVVTQPHCPKAGDSGSQLWAGTSCKTSFRFQGLALFLIPHCSLLSRAGRQLASPARGRSQNLGGGPSLQRGCPSGSQPCCTLESRPHPRPTELDSGDEELD